MKNSRFISQTVLIIPMLILFTLLLEPETIEAQCRMCAASAESNLKNGGTEGKGLNTGILYLLSMPYLIVITIGILYWRNKKKAEEQVEGELIRELLS